MLLQFFPIFDHFHTKIVPKDNCFQNKVVDIPYKTENVGNGMFDLVLIAALAVVIYTGCPKQGVQDRPEAVKA